MTFRGGYFHREVKIKTTEQMMTRLAQRCAESTQAGEPIAVVRLPDGPIADPSKPSPSLTWLPPMRNADETGHQFAGGTDYVVRKTLTEGKVMYWAWYQRKLLGYATDAQGARDFCQAHLEDGP